MEYSLGKTTLALLVVAALSRECLASQYVTQYAIIEENDVELSVKLIDTPLLPFQAVRLQWSLCNKSKNRLGPIMPIDNCSGAKVRGPSHDDYQGLYGSLCIFDRNRSITTTPREHRNRGNQFLQPNEVTSVSFSFSAEWRARDGRWLKEGKSAFGVPGKYSLKCMYLADVDKDKWIEKTITIEVAEPKGDDKAVYELLQKDAALASAMMCPVDQPDKEVVPKLKEVLEKYAKSSYAPYARFALARFYLRGCGDNATRNREDRAKAADELEKIYTHKFPYQPMVIKALIAADAEFEEKLTKFMNKEYPDALEWLEIVAKDMSDDDWRAFRKRKVSQDKKDK